MHNTRLDATGRLFSVDTVSFSESSDRFPKIQAQLLIDAFVYGTSVPGATGVASGVAPTDTSSTETTPTDTTSTTTSTESTEAAAAPGAP